MKENISNKHGKIVLMGNLNCDKSRLINKILQSLKVVQVERNKQEVNLKEILTSSENKDVFLKD